MARLHVKACGSLHGLCHGTLLSCRLFEEIQSCFGQKMVLMQANEWVMRACFLSGKQYLGWRKQERVT
jgi:hypothetical protein